MEPNERRECFRVDKDVIFDVQPVDAQTAKEGNPCGLEKEGPSWQSLNELAVIDQNLQAASAAVATKSATLSRCLSLLNQKLDLIARHTLFSSYQHLPQSRINLSAEGIAFKSERPFYKDSFVILRMIFLPSFAPVITFAQIIRCESRDNSYNVAAKFFRQDAQQQQLIAKHLLKASKQA